MDIDTGSSTNKLLTNGALTDPSNSGTTLTYLAAMAIFYGNTFTNNFAYVGGSAINLVSKDADRPYFAYDECRGMRFEGNTYIGNWGCPSSFGIVNIMCTFHDYKSATNSYSPSTVALTNSDASTSISTQNTMLSVNYTNTGEYTYTYSSATIKVNLGQIHFISETYSKNYGILSSGILTRGAKHVTLENCTFEKNGIYLSDLSSQLIKSPFTIAFTATPITLMKESAAVFISAPILLNISTSTFDGNWAFNSGDGYWGTSVTIAEMLPINSVNPHSCNVLNN